jgi:hypothetical protein
MLEDVFIISENKRMFKIKTNVLFYSLFWISMFIAVVFAPEWESFDNSTYV